MAEITVAESAGFCFGVDRAVKLCYQASGTAPPLWATLGPIIHNQNVVDVSPAAEHALWTASQISSRTNAW